jgi:HAD superfamily hydrolase (TIGR01484 family)
MHDYLLVTYGMLSAGQTLSARITPPVVGVQEIRPEVEKQLNDKASITTALSGMLEVLPKGASKAAGLRIVLEKLNIAPENVMAMGDAENDKEMLKLAGVCVWFWVPG